MEAGIILSAVEAIGDYGAKIQSPLLAYGGYNLLCYTLFGILKTQPLTLVNSYWDGISNLFTMAMGFYMGERFTQTQYFGCLLITAGILML